MFENTTFGKSVELLKKSMNNSMLRRDVIANNLANADVPNFKRTNVNFEATLKKALDSENQTGSFQLLATDERHMSAQKPLDWRSVESRRVLDYLTTSKANGNNVDAEEEAMLSLQNQLTYTLMTQATNHEFQQVNSVLK